MTSGESPLDPAFPYWKSFQAWAAAYKAAKAKQEKYATQCLGEFMLNVRANDKTLSKIGRAFERALAEAAR